MPTSYLIQDSNGVGRVEPAAPVTSYVTHEIINPLRVASCREFECAYWETGLILMIDTRIPQGVDRLLYLRYQSGRRITEQQVEEGVWRIFVHPHQSCFTTHRLPVRDELYVRRAGDWRGNPDPSSRYKFQRPDDWVDSFANTLDQAATRFERG